MPSGVWTTCSGVRKAKVPQSFYSFHRLKSLAAVLVAIAIPVFSSQLEKSREGTDAANIRSEYAVVMTEILTSGDSEFTGKHSVKYKQRTSGWQNTDVLTGLSALSHSVTDSADTSVELTNINNVHSGGSATFSYSKATNTANPKVTIDFGSAGT